MNEVNTETPLVDNKIIRLILENLQAQLDRRFETLLREIEIFRVHAQKELGDFKESTSRVDADRVRALDQADTEREKAAEAFRRELARTILEGDERLREHIAAQREAIERALLAADLLERERIALIDAKVDANSHALNLQAVAQKEAVSKAEAANEKRFESVNEWRAQSSDRERSQMEERARLTESFLLKVVAETQFAALTGRIDTLEARADTSQGIIVGNQASITNRRQIINSTTQVLSVVVGLLSILIVVILATRGFTKY
jgi:hypothetical protein